MSTIQVYFIELSPVLLGWARTRHCHGLSHGSSATDRISGPESRRVRPTPGAWPSLMRSPRLTGSQRQDHVWAAVTRRPRTGGVTFAGAHRRGNHQCRATVHSALRTRSWKICGGPHSAISAFGAQIGGGRLPGPKACSESARGPMSGRRPTLQWLRRFHGFVDELYIIQYGCDDNMADYMAAMAANYI